MARRLFEHSGPRKTCVSRGSPPKAHIPDVSNQNLGVVALQPGWANEDRRVETECNVVLDFHNFVTHCLQPSSKSIREYDLVADMAGRRLLRQRLTAKDNRRLVGRFRPYGMGYGMDFALNLRRYIQRPAHGKCAGPLVANSEDLQQYSENEHPSPHFRHYS